MLEAFNSIRGQQRSDLGPGAQVLTRTPFSKEWLNPSLAALGVKQLFSIWLTIVFFAKLCIVKRRFYV